MVKSIVRRAAWAAFLAMTVIATKAEGAREFVFPMMRKAPSIEKWNPAEWSEAVRFPHFQKFRSVPTDGHRAVAYLGATENALYWAFVTELPPDGQLLKPYSGVADVVKDDLVELAFVADFDPVNCVNYQVLVDKNAQCTFYAHKRGNGQEANGWKEAVVAKSLVTEKDWIVLVKVDVRRIYPTKKLTEAVWQLTACRDWKRPTYFSHVPGAEFNGRDTAIRFSKDAPAVQVEFTKPPHTRRSLTGNLTVKNPSDRVASYDVFVLCTCTDQPERRIAEKVELKPGETRNFAFDAGNIITSTKYWFEASVKGSKGTHFFQKLEWAEPFDAAQWDVKTGPVLPYDFNFAYFPTKNRMRVQPVVRSRKAVATEAEYAVVEKKTGRTVKAVKLPLKDGEENWFDLPELDGDYRIAMSVPGAGKDGRIVKEFERHRFPWEGNGIGKSRKVYAPFEPIRVDGDVLSTVLRRHELGGLGLPRQVVAKDRKLLAAPIRLLANGEEVKGALSFSERSEDRVVAESAFKSGTVSGAAVGTWEYDGALKYALTLERGKLDSLVLEIPLTAAEAREIHSMGNMRATLSATLSKEQGLIWDPTKNPRNQLWPTFATYVYLGNPNRGFSVWMENDKGWSWDRKTNAQEVRREGDRVVLRLNLVNRPLVISKPRTITLGFQAAPVKPRLGDWRSFWYKHEYHGLLTDIVWFGGEGNCGSVTPPGKDFRFWEIIRAVYVPGYPKPSAEFVVELKESLKGYFKGYVQSDYYTHYDRVFTLMLSRWNDRPVKRTPVFYYNRSVWNALEEYRTYMNEWSEEAYPVRGTRPDVDEISITPYSSYNDYALYYHVQSFKYGNKGVYCDNFYPRITRNTVNSDAYVDEDGSIVPASSYWTMRDYAKRCFVAMNELGMRACFWPHMTSTVILPVHGFASAQLDLEWNYGQGFPQTRYPQEYSRLATSGNAIGVTPLVLTDRYGASGEEPIKRAFLGCTLVHEVLNGDYSKFLDGIRKKYVVDHPEVKAIRYWDDDPKPAAIGDENIRWIVYVLPGRRALVVTVNYSDKPVESDFALDLPSLGLEGARLFDYESGKALGALGSTFKVKLDGYGVRYFEFRAVDEK